MAKINREAETEDFDLKDRAPCKPGLKPERRTLAPTPEKTRAADERRENAAAGRGDGRLGDRAGASDAD
jgi:hypothetical protein